MFDILIIGAGPAGVSAAIYAASRGKKVKIIEKKSVGGMISNISTVTHFVGALENESGDKFSERLLSQLKLYNIDLSFEEVLKVELNEESKKIFTKSNQYETKKLIIAAGTSPRKIDAINSENLRAKGMYMNALRDGEKYRDKKVFVVGGADGSVKEALYLSKIAKEVNIIHFEDKLACINEFESKIEKSKNINILLNSKLYKVDGNEKLESLEILNLKTDKITTIKEENMGIFVYAGSTPNTKIFDALEKDNSYIIVDENMQTNIKGVYAIGDIRVKNIRQISTAVSDGTIAAIHATRNI